MNRKMVFNMIGRISRVESIFLLLPAVVSLIYREKCFWDFIIVSAGAFTVGTLLKFIFKPQDHTIYAKEGFAIVATAWIYISAVGALPFFLSGEIPFFTDAFFETVSGFTTTGASVVDNVEQLSRGILFWRSFTHWIGGMGVLVFIMAVVPNVSDRSIHIMRAEIPGPVVGKILPRAKDTAKTLYIIYIFMTVLQIILLLCGGMPLFDSVVHTFGTAGTGGFGIKIDSVASYSPYIQWVIIVFMFLFGVNFNLYYLLLIKRFKAAASSGEFWCYFGVFATASAAIAINIRGLYANISEAIRASVFQVSSIITTTGYSTADFNKWPEFSKAILLVLMLIGACAGSTAGGLKIARVVMFFKMIAREIRRMLHPRSVSAVRSDGKRVDEITLSSTGIYFAFYAICLTAIFLIISFQGFDFETNISAAVSCFNNVGPGFGMVGPAASYSCYNNVSKLALSAAMLMGRLEIFPMLLVFLPTTWRRR